MSTIISTETDTALVIANDDLTITPTGAIVLAGPGVALTLQSTFAALIAGRVEAPDDAAISATFAPGDTLTLSDTASVLSAAENTAAIALDGAGIHLESAGSIAGEATSGVGIAVLAGSGDAVIGNIGSIGGAIGLFGAEDTHLMVENTAGGRIIGTDVAIEAVNLSLLNKGVLEGDTAGLLLTGSLDLVNHGRLSGGVFVASGTEPRDLPPGVYGSPERTTSTIDNRGVIENDDEIAIELGNGADSVANRGLIDGAVALGGGNDHYYGGGIVDGWVHGQGGADRLAGGDGNDRLFGGSGADRIVGRDGNDRIVGGYGVDSINAGNGDDTIKGGGGGDRILTGDGNDLVRYEINDRHSIIGDFETGHDTIDVSDFNLPDFDALLATATETDGDLVFDLRANLDTLTLAGTTLADISEDDFIL
ncbi:MAG: hypothetical protein AcusKO_25870 [Acuticoccus sp.]